jgi:protein-disulfide isomerase
MRPIAMTLLAGLAAVSLAGCGKSFPSKADPADMSLGDPNAPVKLIEYGSVACPHCAVFNNAVFPAFKAKYIDTGQVYYTLREALTGEPPALAVAGFLTARCAGKDKYFPAVDAIFRDQPNIQDNMRAGLLRVAQSAGMTEDQFVKCISDDAQITAINKRAARMGPDGINGTPAFIMNGKVLAQSEMSLADLDAAVAKAGGKAPATAVVAPVAPAAEPATPAPAAPATK